MSRPSSDDLIAAFKDMTLVELSSFVTKFEETFGVTAAPTGYAPPPSPLDPIEEVDAQTEFHVVLEEVGDKKIQVIKEVRSLMGLGLKEAKDLVDNAPQPVMERVSKETADKARIALEQVGAKVIVS